MTSLLRGKTYTRVSHFTVIHQKIHCQSERINNFTGMQTKSRKQSLNQMQIYVLSRRGRCELQTSEVHSLGPPPDCSISTDQEKNLF